MSQIRVDDIVNAADTGGTTFTRGIAGDSGVKAWINFNGTGTIAIRDSFNVSGITDNNTGDYTVTWDTDFANGDYAATLLSSNPDGNVFNTGVLVGSLRINTVNDISYVMIIAFGDQ